MTQARARLSLDARSTGAVLARTIGPGEGVGESAGSARSSPLMPSAKSGNGPATRRCAPGWQKTFRSSSMSTNAQSSRSATSERDRRLLPANGRRSRSRAARSPSGRVSAPSGRYRSKAARSPAMPVAAPPFGKAKALAIWAMKISWRSCSRFGIVGDSARYPIRCPGASSVFP